VCGALATGPGLAFATASAAVTPATAAAALGWRTAQKLPGLAALAPDGGASPAALSCSSPGNCSVGGSYSEPHNSGFSALVADQRDGTWDKAIQVPGIAALNVGGQAAVLALSCTSLGDCTAAGEYAPGGAAGGGGENAITSGFVAAEKNGTWGRAEQVPGISALIATDAASIDVVSCASPLACAATGSYGNGVVFVVSTGTPTATAESMSAAKLSYGREQAERVSVAVTAKQGGPVTGKVTVSAGSATLCVITLHSGRGTCRLTARRLRRGRYQVTAAYPGTGVFISSVSRAKTLTVIG